MNALDFFHLEGTGKLPTIFRHTDAQLDAAIAKASKQIPDFYVLLHGIDAYMERRRRRVRVARERRFRGFDRGLNDVGLFVDSESWWGNS